MADWDALQIFVFDLKRGQQEGHELDKILFFFPVECPLPTQLSVVGLSEGLITFTRLFSPEAPCELIESDRRSHVLYQPETDIWIAMVVEKGKEISEPARDSALKAVLREAHGLFKMFYGSIRALLQKNPAGDVARSCLFSFLPDYLSEFAIGKRPRVPSFKDSLVEKGTIQMLSLEREAALEVQSVVDLLESWFGSGGIRHTLILFNNLLVSTTLPPEDTVNLFTYARLRLTPSSVSQFSSARASRKSSLGISELSATAVSLGVLGNESGHVSSARLPSHDTSMGDQNRKFLVPRPLQHDKWWRDQDGFLVTDAWGVETHMRNAVIPTVWLQHSEEPLQLCAYQLKMLTVIMLISVNSSNTGSEGSSYLRNQVLEKASGKLGKLEERLAKEWGGSNMYHIPGYRYLVVDHDSKVSKGSPPSKVATLSKDSLAALNRVRADIDVAKRRYENKGSECFPGFECCVRTNNSAWVIVRIQGCHEMYMVLERASETLLLTSEAVEKFSKRYCNGIFSSD